MFPVGKVIEELTWDMVTKGLKSEEDLRVEFSGGADVFFKGVEVISCESSCREKVSRFKNNLVLVVIGVSNNWDKDTGEGVGLSVSCPGFIDKREVKLTKIK